MAEICCGTVSESKTQTTCEQPASRAARRKRMEIRRFKIIAGVAEPLVSTGKRQKLDIQTEMKPSRECENALENCVEDDSAIASKINNGSSSPTSSSSNSSSTSDNECSLEATVSNLISLPSEEVKVEKMLSDLCPKYGLSSVCGRRRDMEDAVAVKPSFCRTGCNFPARLHYFGVYDGHGCSHVAMNCRERLHQLVKEEIESSVASDRLSAEWTETMQRSFSRMDNEVLGGSTGLSNTACRCELQKPQCDSAGSTAVVSVVTPEKIIVANCGDSRAVLCRGGKAVPLSIDHKPDRPDELQRIEAAGGRVFYWDGARVLGFLAMSRAIGDNYFKPYVVSEPEVTITDRTAEDDCLILASDGLWDVVSNEMACNIARMCLSGHGPSSSVMTSLTSPGNEGKSSDGDGDGSGSSDKACSDAALLLTKLALARHSSDNVSVVVVDLRRDT